MVGVQYVVFGVYYLVFVVGGGVGFFQYCYVVWEVFEYQWDVVIVEQVESVGFVY